MLPFSSTALTKADLEFYYKSVKLVQEFPEFSNAQLVGSLAAKFYCMPGNKGHLPHVHDLDYFFHEIPETLQGHLAKANLIDRIRRRSRAEGIMETVHWSENEFYTFTQTPYGIIDVFEKKIGSTSVPTNIMPLSWEDPETMTNMQIAHPGVLLAVILNPNDTDDIRIQRSVYLLKGCSEYSSFGFSIEETIDACVKTLSFSGITRSLFQRTMARIENRYPLNNYGVFRENIAYISQSLL